MALEQVIKRDGVFCVFRYDQDLAKIVLLSLPNEDHADQGKAEFDLDSQFDVEQPFIVLTSSMLSVLSGGAKETESREISMIREIEQESGLIVSPNQLLTLAGNAVTQTVQRRKGRGIYLIYGYPYEYRISDREIEIIKNKIEPARTVQIDTPENFLAVGNLRPFAVSALEYYLKVKDSELELLQVK